MCLNKQIDFTENVRQDTSSLTIPCEKIDLIWGESDYFDEIEDEHNWVDLTQIAFENFLEEFSFMLQQISSAGFFSLPS